MGLGIDIKECDGIDIVKGRWRTRTSCFGAAMTPLDAELKIYLDVYEYTHSCFLFDSGPG